MTFSSPAGSGPASLLSLREAFILPRGPGAVARAGLRAQPSDPPPRAIPPAAGHSPACEPSLFPSLAQDNRSGPAYPPAGLAAQDPHAPARWLLPPAGRVLPPPSRLPCTCTSCFAMSAKRLDSFAHPHCGRGAFNPPVPRVADISGARGHPACASAAGGAGPKRSAGNSEGHGAEARCGVAGGGVCRRSARGRTSLQLATVAPAKQKPHAVKQERISPRGKRKPPRSGKTEQHPPPVAPARMRYGPGSPGSPQSSSTRSCDQRFMKIVVGSPDASSTTEAHTMIPDPELTVTFA